MRAACGADRWLAGRASSSCCRTQHPSTAAAAAAAHAALLVQRPRVQPLCTSTSSSNTSISSTSSSSSADANRTAEAGRPLDAYLGPGRLQLMEQAYSVGGRVLRLVSPVDVDAVLDWYIASGMDRDPYWTRAWPSAICLAQQLLQRPHLVAGKRVADFGAGLGVAGLAAALAGAREVVLLDREPMALACGLLSATASGVAGVAGLEAMQQQVEADALAAASSSAAQQQQALPSAGLLQLAQQYMQQKQQQPQQQLQQQQPQQAGPPPLRTQQPEGAVQAGMPPPSSSQQQPAASCSYRAQVYDWSATDASDDPFDVVLACDVLYEAEAVDAVAAAIPQLLRRSGGGLLLLTDPPNRTAGNRQRFVELLSCSSGGSGGGGAPGLRLLLEESATEQCQVAQLDPEMLGGVGQQESVAVQLMVFRATNAAGDTIGLKARP